MEGAVGSKLVGDFRLFRYEIRRWQDGVIPDIAEAVSSPVRLSEDPTRASQLLDLVPRVPALVWGRDEGRTGEMWNSNSVVAWLLAGAGLDPDRIPATDRGSRARLACGRGDRASSQRRLFANEIGGARRVASSCGELEPGDGGSVLA